MVPTPTPASIIIMFFGVLIFIILMLLPSIIELKNPKDPGPRIIKDSAVLDGFGMKINSVEGDVERKLKFDELIVKKVSEVLAILPSLEP
jgi:hypothetical protein